MKTITSNLNWPPEYTQINNCLMAQQLEYPALCLAGQLPSGGRRLTAQGIADIRAGHLAAQLMAHIEADLGRCMVRPGQSKSWRSDVINGVLPLVWKSCMNLAKKGVSQPPTRKLYEDALALCRAATTHIKNRATRPPFAPVPTTGNRHEFLCKGEPEIRTFFGHSLWAAAAHMLQKLGMPAYAEQLLLDFWQHYEWFKKGKSGNLSVRNRRKSIYRSHASYMLTQHYLDVGERASAARWALLTFIHDVQTSHFPTCRDITWDATGATSLLWSRFGVSEVTLRHMYDKILEFENRDTSGEWRDCLYPEFVLAMLMSEPGCNFPLELRCQPGNRLQHPLNRDLLDTLAEKIGADFPTTTAKGIWLERMMGYLFSTIEGLRVRRHVTTETGTEEIDLLVECLPHAADLLAQRLGKRMIVECKHTAQKFSAPQLFELVGKMTYNHCDTGMVVCTGGFTGKQDVRKAAVALAQEIGPSTGLLLVNWRTLKKAITGQDNEPPHFLMFLVSLCDNLLDRRAYLTANSG